MKSLHLICVCFQYAKSNIRCIIQKIASKVTKNPDEIRSFFMRNDPNGNGTIQFEQLGSLLQQIDPSLTTHEIMTLARFYGVHTGEEGMETQKLIAIVQEQLRKRNFEGFGKLMEALQQHDRERYCSRECFM